MNNSFDERTVTRYGTAETYNVGLRAYMQKVFTLMAMGLALTGAVSFGISQSPEAMKFIFGTPFYWVALLAPLGIVFFMSYKSDSLAPATAQTLFYVYAAALGVSLSMIFLQYKLGSIARVFFITGGTFAAMSLYGYTTKKDLTSMGSFLMMGLIGIIIASLVNIFFQSSALQFVISVISVLVFTGLTAYDTQKIKDIYYVTAGDDRARAAIFGALSLYMDFINLFLSMLRLFGERR